MELLTLIDLKTSQPPAIEKKEKKDQKKDPLPPKNSNVILDMLSFPQRGEKFNINLC